MLKNKPLSRLTYKEQFVNYTSTYAKEQTSKPTFMYKEQFVKYISTYTKEQTSKPTFMYKRTICELYFYVY